MKTSDVRWSQSAQRVMLVPAVGEGVQDVRVDEDHEM